MANRKPPAGGYRRFFIKLIRTYRPGFAILGEPARFAVAARLARMGLSARNIGRVLGVSKSTILGLSWRSRKRKRDRVRLVGGLPNNRALNNELRKLPRYPRRYM